MSEATPLSLADAHASLIAQHASLDQELTDVKAQLAHLIERRKKLHADLRDLKRLLEYYQRMKNPKRRTRVTE